MNDSKAYIDRLRRIRELNTVNPNFVNKDLYRWICKDAALIEAYEQIKNNKGALTPGIGSLTLEGFGRQRIDKLRESLLNESWTPKPARRIMIPKPGKKEKRPLGIQGPEEKIVQAAVYRLLEAIYEPTFYNCSYGFRPNRGCHDALSDISQKYDGIIFAIEGDIKGMYDNVNHHILIDLLKRRINDERFISLIWKLLRTGYMKNKNPIVTPEIATPQGSIVSPILANIYLHEFDTFMQSIVTESAKGSSRTKVMTPISMELKIKRKSIERKIARIEKGKIVKNTTREQLLKDIRALRMKSLTVRTYKDPQPRVYYHRYADDFIIGIAGSYNLAETIKDQCSGYLSKELNLTLSQDKTKITNIRKAPALFLGHEIIIDTSNRLKYVHVKGKTPFLKRTTGKFVKLQAPMERAINRMHLKGFCNGEGFPTPKRNWTNQEDNQIVQLYNITIRGWFHFYKGAHYQHRLGRMWYIMRYSCAMTLASKHKSSLSKIFKKHGALIKVLYGKPDKPKSIELFKPDMKERSRKFYVGKQVRDPYALIAYRTSQTMIDDKCAICGQPSSHMHHLNPQRKANPGTSSYVSGLLKRKQIPTCVECHIKIHNGLYEGKPLKSLIND